MGQENRGIEVLPNPIISATDGKEYRSLRLPNGLRVLLISDCTYPLEKLDEEEKLELEMELTLEDEDDDYQSCDDEELEDEEEEFQDVEEAPKRASKSLSGLKKSAAGLCIGMGSFSDPEDLPGLAHFLEHMVFMGSKKFPDENSFDNFIQTHGGTDNASTDCETTVFFFEAQRKYFHEGLDRFAQFFINPLMKKEAMQREREAVDSEFQMSLPSDYHRKQQIFGSISRPKHPMSKFMWGNLESLQTMDDSEFHKRLLAFKDRHYSAGSMTLVVQSQETLDTLQQWTEQSFYYIPNNGLPRETFGHLLEPFNTSNFNKIYKVSPIQNTYQLDFNWALPSMLDKYRVKPLHYLSWIIGHEGKGSLVSYLRKKVWALSLTAGNAGDGFEHNSTYAIFTITVELTKKGFDNVSEVMDAIFSYLKMLEIQGPSERIYKEIQKIEQLDFEFGEEVPPLDNVETICESMQFYPPELYLTGDDLMFEFNGNLIQDCTKLLLNMDGVNVFMMAKEFEDTCKEVEPWFKTNYAVEEIAPEVKACWKSITPFPEFHLPEPNVFIAENTTLLPAPEDQMPYPVKIVEDSKFGELFFRQDTIFKQPRANFNFHICSPVVMESVENAVCLDLMLNCATQIMIEDTYPADLAQLHFYFYPSERGVVLKLSGLNDKLPLLLSEIMKHLADIENQLTPELFGAIKDQTKKNYYNTFINPGKLVREVRLIVLQDVFFGTQIRHSIVSEITLDAVKDFCRKFKKRIYVQALVQGNITKDRARALFESVKSGFPKAKGLDIVPEIRCNEIPLGETYLRVKSLNPQDNNTVITNYYQAGPGNLREHLLLEIACMLMEEPVFDVLRTKEQLGYSVFSMLRNTFGVLGLSITITSQENKFKADFVDQRIESFLDNFVNDKMANFSDDAFDQIITTLIKMKKAADVTLDEEITRNWGEIMSREYLFGRCAKEIDLFETHGKKKDVQNYLRNLVKKGSRYRKLGVQVVGNPEIATATGDSNVADDPDGKFIMQLVNVSNGNSGEEDGKKFIKDIQEFKSALKTHPVLHITE